MYYMNYYFPKQSRMFSEPYRYVCNTKKELANALFISETNGYEVVSSGKVTKETIF